MNDLMNRFRRPHTAVAISIAALFVALGGVGWAATQLPANSVGTRQLRDRAVTANKIDPNQVQLRVSSRCAAPTAITSITRAGDVNCRTSFPTELGTNSAVVTVSTAPTTVATRALPAGSSYLVIADQYVTITGAVNNQTIQIPCTVAANGVSQARQIQGGIGAKQTAEVAIPLVLAAPRTSSAGVATVQCSIKSVPASPVPQTTAQSTIAALQTGSNS